MRMKRSSMCLKRIDSIARVAKARRIFQDFPAALDRIQEVVQRIRALMERAEQTPPPQPSEASTASRCEHSRLDEDGICRACGLDCRGIG